MKNKTDKRHHRMRADQNELAERIARALPRDGALEPQPGLHFRRHSRQGERVYGFYPAAFCIIAQGSKDILLGMDTFRFDPAHYLISTLDLPLAGEVVEASPERPYLSVRLVLDPAIVTSVLVESELVQARGKDGVKAIDVSPLDADLLDAALRLVRRVDTPNEYRVLAPLIVREIVYRLLTGAQGARMHQVARFGGQAHRMVRAVRRIREHFHEPLRIEDIARELNMSLSGFHAHFKAVTAMSPLQFQKELRHVERFRQEGIGSCGNESLDRALGRVRAQDNDRGMAGCVLAAQAPQDFLPRDVGEVQIEEDRIGPMLESKIETELPLHRREQLEIRPVAEDAFDQG